MLRCLNGLCHVNLDVSVVLWRKDSIFWEFSVSTMQIKNRKNTVSTPIIPRIKSHKLGEITYVLHWIYLAIVTGERWVSEVSRHLDAFISSKKGDRAILLRAWLMAFMAAYRRPLFSL